MPGALILATKTPRGPLHDPSSRAKNVKTMCRPRGYEINVDNFFPRVNIPQLPLISNYSGMPWECRGIALGFPKECLGQVHTKTNTKTKKKTNKHICLWGEF